MNFQQIKIPMKDTVFSFDQISQQRGILRTNCKSLTKKNTDGAASMSGWLAGILASSPTLMTTTNSCSPSVYHASLIVGEAHEGWYGKDLGHTFFKINNRPY